MDPLLAALGAPAVRHASMCIDVPGGRVEVSYYNERPPGYCAQPAGMYPSNAQNDAAFAAAPPSVATGRGGEGEPQVSGQLGDGKLLARGKNLVKLLVELGLIKPFPLPM